MEHTAKASTRTVTREQQEAPQTFSLIGRRGAWKDALRRRMLAVADVCAASIATVCLGLFVGSDPVATLYALGLAPLWILLAKARGLYNADHVKLRHQTIDEISGLVDWVTISVGLTILGLALAGSSLATPSGAVAMWVAAFVSVIVLRAGARMLWRRVVPAERGLLVGEGQLADAMARKLNLERGHHLSMIRRVGIAGDSGLERPDTVPLDELSHLVRQERVERVIVAVHDLDEDTLSAITGTCRSLGVKLSVAPPLRAMLGTAVELTHLAELPVIEFHTWDPSRSTMLFKRIGDVIGSALLLVLVSPLLLAIAAWVRLDSPGPAIYRQLRAERDGHPFWMLKFRTMVKDADLRISEVISLDEMHDPVFKLRRDPRVTRAGAVLRRWSLDELPQLVNVLLGQMSLVGPRPEETWLVDRYSETERFRLTMSPGMTGPMQVHGRGELTFQERMAVEREYIENYSIRKDAKILLRTASAVLWGEGAY